MAVAENPEIFNFKEGSEVVIETNLFFNLTSIIRLIDFSIDEATFEIESVCSIYA
jgi:hypothetical protein